MVGTEGRHIPRTVPASELMDRLEIEARAQRAAKEELEGLFQEVVVLAERHGEAARFLGGHWLKRWDKVIERAREALIKQREMSMREEAVMSRRWKRERRRGH